METAQRCVCPRRWLFDDLPTALEVAKIVTEVSHSHPEGIKGTAVVLAMNLARQGTMEMRFEIL